ncbi:MAG: RNA polymerase sigma factor [Deltaproteobacteria bacterium]|nr:RNA polymerase sigma factor [Deltaproteobacteria bacterium]
MGEPIAAETIEAATAGDRGALSSIVRALQGRFYDLALRMRMDPSDAEEVTQEALLSVVTHLSEFRGESQFTSWAHRIAVNRILDEKRRGKRRPMLTFEAHAADLADGLDPSATESPEDAVLLAQVKVGCGRALLQCLDDDHRLAYVLGEILELDGEVAADIAGTSHATYRKRLSRARSRLHDALTERCGLVSPSAPCRCHRRLGRARELGRLDDSASGPPLVDLVQLRRTLADVDALRRAAVYFRADPAESPTRDFTEVIRATLDSSSLRPS